MTVKVYLVIRNDTDCEFVEGVFITKERAEEFRNNPPNKEYGEYKIKEYDAI